MTAFYDLLGIHPDADDEALRRAFRQALAAKPAGHSVSADPLFQDIVAAGILEDAKQRAVYQRLLEGERQRLKTKSKRIVTTNAIAACLAILAATVAVGYAVLPPLGDTATIFAAPDDDNSPTDAAAAADSKDSNAATAATPPSKKKDAPLPAKPTRRTADTAIAAEAARKETDTPPAAVTRDFGTPAAAAAFGKQAAAPSAANDAGAATVTAAVPGRDADTAPAVPTVKGDAVAVTVPAVPMKEGDAPPVAAAARKEGPVALAEARGDIGPAVAAALVQKEAEANAAVRRNDQAVAAAAPAGDKDGSALTFLTPLGTFPISPPGGRPETAAAQPATPTEPKAADGPVDKPKRAELPDSPAEQGAAATDSGPRLTLGLSENTRTRNDALFYRERGVISYKRGALQQAVSDLDEAVRLDRGDAQAYNLRGDVLDEMGAFERALADYDDAIRLDPNNGTIFHDRAIMWHRKGELDKALADMDRAIRSNFADAKLYCDRGLIWYEKGSYDRAVADFNRAVRLSPTLTATCLRRGVLLHRNGEFNLAFAAAYPAIRVDPKIFDVYRRSTRQSATHPPQTAPGAATPEPAGDP